MDRTEVFGLQSEQSGYVIERYVNSELRFWDGMYTDERSFMPKSETAIRFARECDAAHVLSWLLGGQGRVALHVWSPVTSKQLEMKT